MRAALAVLLLALGLAGSAGAALQEPRHGWALVAAAPGPLPPPPDAAWEPVPLPDDAAITRPGRQKLPAWYRIAFDYPAGTAPPARWAAYLPYFYDGGALWLNGALLASVAENTDELHARSYRPQMIAFPAPLLRAGHNELLVRTAPSSIYALRFPRVVVGPEAEILPLYDQRLFWSRTVPQITVIVSLLIAGMVLFIWWRRRAEVLYGLFGLAALLWGVRTMTFVIDALPEQTWNWWRLAYHSTTGGFIVVMALFSLRYAGLRRPWLERALIVYWTIGPLWYALRGFAAEPVVARVWLGGMLPIGIVIMAAAFWSLRKRDAPSALVLPAAMAFAAVAGIHDYLMSWHTPLLAKFAPQWVGYRIHLLHYGSNTLLLAMGALLTARFVQTLSSLEDLNRTLETRVADREHALADNYSRLAALEREHAASQERQLIMRDLHDGLGSQLFTSLSRVERGDMDSGQIASALRTCIADMRLALDALASEEHELGAALGNFMFRWEPQLLAAGVRPSWVIDLPDDGGVTLSPHAALQLLRVAQEALTNVLKHAHATHVEVRLRRVGAMLEMEVQDDGRGLDGSPSQGGHGMASMRSRAQRLGAQFELHSGSDGTCVLLRLPIGATAAA